MCRINILWVGQRLFMALETLNLVGCWVMDFLYSTYFLPNRLFVNIIGNRTDCSEELSLLYLLKIKLSNILFIL